MAIWIPSVSISRASPLAALRYNEWWREADCVRANETARDLSACPAELQFLGRVPAAQFSQTINNKTRSSATELNVDEHGPIQQSAAIRRVAEDDGHVFVGARSGQPQFSGCHPSSTAARF